MRRLHVLALGLFLGCLDAQPEEVLRVYSARRTSQPPTMDGKLAEQCWANAERTSPFVLIHGAPASAQTRGMLCWDDEALYVGIVCGEPLSAKLRGLMDTGAVQGFEESIEVFVDADFDRHTYLQFMLSVLGEKFSARGMARDPSLDASWTAGVSIGNGQWTVELRLPLEMLGISQPSEKALCGLNLNRTRTIGGKTAFTCWSDTKGGFHTPSRFGRLIFVGYSDWLKANIQDRLVGVARESRGLLADYRVTTPSLTARRQALTNQRNEFVASLSTTEVDEAMAFTPVYSTGESLVARAKELLADVRLGIIGNQFQRFPPAERPQIEALKRVMGAPQVRIEHKEEDREAEGKPVFRRESWRFDTGLRCPQVNYSRYLNVAPALAGRFRSLVNTDMGIGLDGGSYCNWYRGDCLRVHVNGKDVFAARAADSVEWKEADNGHLRFVWQMGEGRSVALNLTVPNSGMAVFARIDLNLPGLRVDSLRVDLRCFPGGFGPYHSLPSHRWVTTSCDGAEVSKEFQATDATPFPTLPLTPGQTWVFYADKLQHRGSLGLLILPEERASGVIKMSNYGQATSLDYPVDTARIRLGLYAFDIENGPAKKLFVSSIPMELDRLRSVPFWSD